MRAGLDPSTVGGGDRLDDGQAEAEPAVSVGTVDAESLERLE
jgi:hypothetical protein